MTDFGIPCLRDDRLSSLVPTQIHTGGPVSDPAHTLFVWRTAALSKARGCIVAFYRWDSFFEAIWRNPHRYTDLFLKHGVTTLVECDFSLWRDDPLIVQAYNVFRTRSLARCWQEAGLLVIPSLNWSDERSFEFCFQGVPLHAPLVAVECRTAGQTDDDRRAFLAGLSEGVRQVRPANVLVYGGSEHAYWLSGSLPPGPQFTLLQSWTSARDQLRKQARQQLRHRNQLVLTLPTKGTDVWADEDPAAAARVAALP